MEQIVKDNLFRVLLAASMLLVLYILLIGIVAYSNKESIFTAISDVTYSLETFNFKTGYGPLLLFFSLFLGGLATYILEFLISLLRHSISGAIYMRQIVRMNNHVIVIGAGRIGSRIAENLRNAGYQVLIIEKDPVVANEIKEQGFKVLVGDGTDEKELKFARIEKAIAVFCVMGQDVNNLIASINARQLNKSCIIISRCNSPKNVPKFKAFGVDDVIMPEIVGADSMFADMRKLLKEKKK